VTGENSQISLGNEENSLVYARKTRQKTGLPFWEICRISTSVFWEIPKFPNLPRVDCQPECWGFWIDVEKERREILVQLECVLKGC
jgi:hypothetical protein